MNKLRSLIARSRVEFIVLIIAGGILLSLNVSRGNIEVILYKSSLLALATLLVHFSRHYLFPYGSLGEMVKKGGARVQAAAVLGILIFMGLVIHAFLSGI
jgi:hypothetical protein